MEETASSSSPIAQALQKARYNEIVQLTIRHDKNENENDALSHAASSSRATTRVVSLVACLDPQHGGGIQWNPLPDDNDVDHGQTTTALARHLQTKRWIFPMLNDHRRNRLYDQAIRAAVQKLAERYYYCNNNHDNKPEKRPTTVIDIHALDIGSGTGLLGMITARHLKQAFGNDDKVKLQVTSIEMASAMTQIARQTIHDNRKLLTVVDNHNSSNKHDSDDSKTTMIQVVEAHSTDLPPTRPPAQLCVSELLESGLLGEGILPALRDAWQRHLQVRNGTDNNNNNGSRRHDQHDAIMIPQRARVYAQLVQGHQLVGTNISDNGTNSNDAVDDSNDRDYRSWISNFYGPHNNGVARAFHRYHQQQHNRQATMLDDDDDDNNNNTYDTLQPPSVITPPRFSTSAEDHDDKKEGSLGLLLDAALSVGPIHARKLFRDQSLVALTDPVQILHFDFNSRDAIMSTVPPLVGTGTKGNSCHPPTASSITVTTTTIQQGTVEAVLVWWQLDLWDNDLTYSTDPHTFSDDEGTGNSDWQDHWQCCLHVLPPEDCRPLRPGDSVALRVSHTDERIVVALATDQEYSSSGDAPAAFRNKRPRHDPRTDVSAATTAAAATNRVAAHSSTLISPMRAAQLNDEERLLVWIQAISLALSQKGKDALVLDLSDFCWCACLATSLGATQVVSIESSSDSELAMTSARVAQLANGFPRPGGRFDILQCHTVHLSLEALSGQEGRAAEIVMAEYYQVLEGWHLQEALNFYYTVRSLRKRKVISGNAKVLPGMCRVVACAIESAQLRSAYAPCGDADGRLVGFDHSYINKLGSNFNDYWLCLPMWQYDYTRLSDNVELATLDFEDEYCNADLNKVVTSRTQFTVGGSFDAVLVWLEFHFSASTGDAASADPASTASTLMFSMSGQSSLQLVRMTQCSKPIFVGNAADSVANLVCRFSFCGLGDHTTPTLEARIENTEC